MHRDTHRNLSFRMVSPACFGSRCNEHVYTAAGNVLLNSLQQVRVRVLRFNFDKLPKKIKGKSAESIWQILLAAHSRETMSFAAPLI